MVKLAGGEPVIIPTTAAEGFRLSAAALKRHLTPRTKALILNSPSNPTGVVLSRQDMAELAKVLEGTNVLVCSDEIYEKLVYGASFASFGASSEDALARTITVNGFSKAYAMTGWRLGYAAGPKAVIDAMKVLQGQSTSGANSVTQKAAVAALELKTSDLEPAVASLQHARDLMVKELSPCRLLSFDVPQGAFYLFIGIGSVLGKKSPEGEVIRTGDDLGMYLLRKAHVGVVPGSGFGCDPYLRLSYATTDANITAGARKLVAALVSLR
jgi:aspartate aminotransferase